MKKYVVYFINWEGEWEEEVFDNKNEAEKYVEKQEDNLNGMDEAYEIKEENR